MRHCYIVCLTLAFALLPTAMFAQQQQEEETGEQLRILIDGEPMEVFFERAGKVGPENIVQAFRETVSNGQPSTGFASLVERNLPLLLALSQQNPPNQPPELVGDVVCDTARAEKEAWHLQHNNNIPDAFGKIVSYNIHEVNPAKKWWAGHIALCTWIHNIEYYFEIGFPIRGTEMLEAHKRTKDPSNPFPGTLNLASLPTQGRDDLVKMMKMWDWKLHAAGDSMVFLVARENGNDLPVTDSLFDPENNCYDMFLTYPPTKQLPNQLNYCMGRCDARVINSK